ncbi:MAG: response regulator [Candidatus Omnitrophica bacterium]|nr:response regulator [Candidatus Omnitrophota bacterium]
MMSKPSILIVEDETIVANDIKDILETAEYNVSGVVFSGEQAIKHIEENVPDLVLMDIKLSGRVDGIDAAKRISNSCDIPIVYLTAYGDKETLTRVKDTSVFGYVLKPFNETELSAVIEVAFCRYKTYKMLKEENDKLEKIVFTKTRELSEMKEKVEHANCLSRVGTLVSTVAHELKNPVAVMKVALYGIKNDTKRIFFERDISTINTKVWEIEEIIKNLSNYSKARKSVFRNIAVMDFVKECVSQCEEQYCRDDVNVGIEQDSKSDKIIEADAVGMMELIFNILNNAYQSFGEREGEIRIRIDFDEGKNLITLIFSDNGEGIDNNSLSKVFEPFFTLKPKGIGLGLSVCKQIVKLHGGSIDIESEKGKGTKVSVNLPIRQSLSK